MNKQDEYIKELIERSARIDRLVIESKEAATDKITLYDQELTELRFNQQETTKILHELEKTNQDTWENIGDGG